VRSGLFEQFLEKTDPRYVHFLLDTGHLAAGGADALAVCQKHRARLVAVHLKDFAAGAANGKPIKAGNVPFSAGSVDLPGIVRFLRDSNFQGYVMGESGGTNLSMHAYMTEALRLTI
jgi:inosose dehydratase